MKTDCVSNVRYVADTQWRDAHVVAYAPKIQQPLNSGGKRNASVKFTCHAAACLQLAVQEAAVDIIPRSERVTNKATSLQHNLFALQSTLQPVLAEFAVAIRLPRAACLRLIHFPETVLV